MKLAILSGGAAQGLAATLAPQFETDTGCGIAGTFGAVGAMRDKLLAGAPADLLILTHALIAELARAGHVLPGSAVDIGVVRTGVAVRAGAAPPPIADAAALRSALLAADAIYFPDPKLATAGIHFAKVLDALGIAAEVAARLRPFPNGAAAMQALARAPDARPIGCTQVTEILNTPGVALVGPLPIEFELATVYTAGVCTRAALPDQARDFAALLGSPAARAVREQAGFEPVT
jgi:molybdate transport system substrate-binding protein